MSLHVEVVSPERILWTGEAQLVLARTIGGGDIAFLTGHAPFVGALDIHAVTVRAEDGTEEVLPRATLCRCGGSARKPFCDNTHLRNGFQAPGEPFRIRLSAVRRHSVAEPMPIAQDPRGAE